MTKKQITIYVDDDIYQEIINLMTAKVRNLTFIANELMRQAIKEKNRKKKGEKQNNPISDYPTNSRQSHQRR